MIIQSIIVFVTGSLKLHNLLKTFSDELSHSWKSNWCVWCGSLYSPENIKVRLIPKIPLSSNLKKLLKKYSTQPHSLGKYQNHIIGRYLRSKNKVVSKTFSVLFSAESFYQKYHRKCFSFIIIRKVSHFLYSQFLLFHLVLI